MSGEFRLENDQPPAESKPLSAEDQQKLEEMLARRLEPDERLRLEKLLLERIKQSKTDLENLLAVMGDHLTYEDAFYRYYHGSFKVYRVQDTTQRAVQLLRGLLPERELNRSFAEIISEGTGKEFVFEHNRDWSRHVRLMLEAFAHSKFMIEMAVRYATLEEPPQPMPSGYAALLYLYDLR